MNGAGHRRNACRAKISSATPCLPRTPRWSRFRCCRGSGSPTPRWRARSSSSSCSRWSGRSIARWLDNPLLFPTFGVTLAALWDGLASGELEARSWVSLSVLLVGYGAGVVLAFALAVIAITSRLGNDFLETMTAMFNPLPAIALLPLALLWFGARHRQSRVRAHPFRAVGGRAQCPCGLQGGAGDDPHGRPQLRPWRPRAGVEDPAAGGVSKHPRRPQDRMGICLAHPDRGRARVRHHVRLRRARDGTFTRTRTRSRSRTCSRDC